MASEPVIRSYSVWRHYKGTVYRVICVAKTEAGMLDVVVYRAVSQSLPQVWVRSVESWLESVTLPDGTTTARFTRVEG